MASLDLNMDDYFADANGAFDEKTCHNYKEDKEYLIMKDFLQPDTTMSLQTASESLLDLIPEHCKPGSLVAVIHLCANVTPWHHTAHLKLAWLAERLRWSPKMSPVLGSIKGPKDSYLTMQCFSDALWMDHENAESYDPDSQSDLDQWVNFNAYLANLDALHFTNGGGETRDPNDEAYGRRGRDANVLAAAQWILWNGQNMRRYAIYPKPPAGSTTSDEDYFNLEFAGASLEHWHIWKQGFDDARNDDTPLTKQTPFVHIRA
ncbi:hypothetical protein GE09DRAFT_1190808 [Coniochaeta sp. 2T2.1]|nr:hypothetical protein GE09DRAFT_1190808 [Coniochaeta sp. 2T2.1]